MTDEEWELIADLVAPYWTPSSLVRPVRVNRGDVVNVLFCLAVTGCQGPPYPTATRTGTLCTATTWPGHAMGPGNRSPKGWPVLAPFGV